MTVTLPPTMGTLPVGLKQHRVMKTIYKGIMAATALAAVSMAIPAMSSALKSDRLLTAERLQPKRNLPAQKKAIRKAAPAGIPYWQTATSIYNAEGKTDLENGLTREFGTHIEIEGETAKIYGLVDVNYNGYFEIDEEYAVEGVYNERYGTITITGTDYDPSRPLDEYVKLAEIYSPNEDISYTIVLIAGDCDVQGNVNTAEELVFDVSDDLSTLRPKSGYGAYAFTSDGQGQAFLDYYKTSKIEKAPETPSLKANTDNLAFKGQFVAAGMPVKEQIRLMNTGASAGTYTVSTSSPWLTVTPAEGSVDGCSTLPLTVTFAPEEPGMFNGKITIQGGGQTIDVYVNTEVREVPDYTKIVQAGSDPIEFEMSPVYPFVISEVNGNTVAESINNGEGDNTESWFKCIVDVPEGQSGVFSWQAMQECQQPNTLLIMLDGEWVKYEMYRPNTEPYDMSGALALTQGKHEIVFDNVISMDWSIYDTFQRSYVWDLNFKLMEAKDDNAALVKDAADFGETYFDKLSVRMDSEVTVLNVGKNPMKVLSVTSDGNFGGTVPEISVPAGGEIKVPLTWDTSAVGDDSGTVTIHTTGGDLEVACSGKAIALPYDYTCIVAGGEFSFNTGRDWPFKPNDKGTYAYNTTSKADINGITYSWLEASFEVPEGKVGHLSWDAINDSEDIFVFMETPSLISGTLFTIDGINEQMVGGQDTHCGSAELYSDIDLTFRPGRHTVKFNYKKTGNEDKFVFGEDRLKLFEIALRLTDSENGEGELSVSNIEYPNEVYAGTTAHAYATLHNFTSKTPEFISSECDGPFKAVKLGEEDGNLQLAIEFTPEKEGDYRSDLVVKTNIGDYTIACRGKAKDCEYGNVIYYEGFEYDFGNDWIMVDGGGQDNFWKPSMTLPEVFVKQGMAAYDGNGLMYVSYFDPESTAYYDVIDTYASTPLITIPEDGKTTLQFMLDAFGYSSQTLDIFVGEGDDPTTFTKLNSVVVESSTTGWHTHSFDLGAWAGKEIHIAFHAGNDIGSYFALDNVMVASTAGNSVDMLETDDNCTVEYYTPDGLRHERPVSGLNIIVTRRNDGTVSTRKEWMK